MGDTLQNISASLYLGNTSLHFLASFTPKAAEDG